MVRVSGWPSDWLLPRSTLYSRAPLAKSPHKQMQTRMSKYIGTVAILGVTGHVIFKFVQPLLHSTRSTTVDWCHSSLHSNQSSFSSLLTVSASCRKKSTKIATSSALLGFEKACIRTDRHKHSSYFSGDENLRLLYVSLSTCPYFSLICSISAQSLSNENSTSLCTNLCGKLEQEQLLIIKVNSQWKHDDLH